VGWEDVESIRLDEDMKECLAVVNKVMNLRVPKIRIILGISEDP
jgi:hypothetical protein